MKSSARRKIGFSHTMGGVTRKVWAIHHRLGVSLVQAPSGVKAAKRAELAFGTAAGPYTVLRNQEQEIAFAKAMGAKIL